MAAKFQLLQQYGYFSLGALFFPGNISTCKKLKGKNQQFQRKIYRGIS